MAPSLSLGIAWVQNLRISLGAVNGTKEAAFPAPEERGGILGRRRTTRNSRETNRLQLRELNLVSERKYPNVERVASIRRALRTGRYRYLNEKATRMRDQNAAQRVRNCTDNERATTWGREEGGKQKNARRATDNFWPEDGRVFLRVYFPAALVP